MKSSLQFSIAAGLVIAGILAAPALAQSSLPYGIATFGAFREMAMQRDYSAKTKLDAAAVTSATDGVGAVTDARGEITILDGKTILTYGRDGEKAGAQETAMLLTTANVHDWQSIPVERDVGPDDIEAYLLEQAKTHGIDAARSFPFRLRGTLTKYSMHVVVSPGPGHPPLAITTQTGNTIDGVVVGFYAAPPEVGIITHPGERTHSHWIDNERTRTAHLDSWGIKAGAVLFVPKQ